MTQRKSKRKGLAPEERGLITRVAAITGRSMSMVSMVNSGKAKSRVVSEALKRERTAMKLKREEAEADAA